MHARDSHLEPTNKFNSVLGAEVADGSAMLRRLGYSVAEAASITSISKAKLWELIKTGELGSTKVAGRRIVRHTDLIALLNKAA